MISLEWLAGFFDGEGYIGIYGRKRNWRLLAGIAQCNKEILTQIQTQFGGCLYAKLRRSVKHNQGWELRWSSQEAATLLKQLFPYLRIKREQAEFVLTKFLPLIPSKGHRPPLSDENLQLRLDAKHQLAKLKPYSKLNVN